MRAIMSKPGWAAVISARLSSPSWQPFYLALLFGSLIFEDFAIAIPS
jgi:hypothetical protein